MASAQVVPEARDDEASPQDAPAILALPPPPPQRQRDNELDVSSGSACVRLDLLGPVVVAEDGTLARIGNWHLMTPEEQANTQRIISARNNKRLAALRAAQARIEPLD